MNKLKSVRHSEQASPAARIPSTFRAFYEAELEYVTNTLLRLGTHFSDIDDLTQEVFIRALQTRQRFDVQRAARPWLFGIAFRVLSEHRRQNWIPAGEAEFESEDYPTDALGPEQSAEAAESRAMLLRVLAGLPLDRRAVFVMYELNEHSMTEVARELKMPLFSAYTRLRLARRQVKAIARRLRAAPHSP